MRSLLFVPADNAKKLQRSLASGADALILDLEDSVAEAAKATARSMAAEFIASARQDAAAPRLFVRINPLSTAAAHLDLEALMPSFPDAIMLPKSGGGADVQHLSVKLAVHEARRGRDSSATGVIPIATETGASIFAMGTYAGSSSRLLGLTWGAEDLSADLSAETNRLPDGSYAGPYALARSLTLCAAAAAAVEAIDTVFAAYRDAVGFRAECEAARRDGFTAKMAIHPDQVGPINEVFTPSAAAIAEAREIVAIFADNPGAGVVGSKGTMLDRPHFLRAQRLLARVPGRG